MIGNSVVYFIDKFGIVIFVLVAILNLIILNLILKKNGSKDERTSKSS